MAGQSVGSLILFTDVGGLVGTLLTGILGPAVRRRLHSNTPDGRRLLWSETSGDD